MVPIPGHSHVSQIVQAKVVNTRRRFRWGLLPCGPAWSDTEREECHTYQEIASFDGNCAVLSLPMKARSSALPFQA